MKNITGIILAFFIGPFTLMAQRTLQFADSIRKVYGIPELSYAVVTGNSILEMQATGYHSVALPDTATLNDRFHIGSNTKAMTAFIIARYVEKGKLNWDSRFFHLFPEWKDSANAGYYTITLQELLSHRAGVPPFLGENDPVIPAFTGTAQQKRKAFARFVLALPPVEKDTAHAFVYSNAGYTLATLMVEKVSNKSWEELVESVFNQELHLNIKLSWPENQKGKDTWGHSWVNDTLIPVPSDSDYHLDFTEPAGDINIKLKDYIRYLQLNLQGLKGHSNYLKGATYRFMHKGISDYALGWYNSYENNTDYSTHAGTAGTYYTLVAIDRKKYTGYIIFTNAFHPGTINGVRLLMRKLKEHYSR